MINRIKIKDLNIKQYTIVNLKLNISKVPYS